MPITWEEVKKARDARLGAQKELRGLYDRVPDWANDADAEARRVEARLDARIEVLSERETELFDGYNAEQAAAGDTDEAREAERAELADLGRDSRAGAALAKSLEARTGEVSGDGGPLTANQRDNRFLRDLVLNGPSEQPRRVQMSTTESRLVSGYAEYRAAGGRPCAGTFGRDVEHRSFVPGDVEHRVLQAGVATGAAEAVPESLLPRIVMFMQDNATVLQQNAEVLTTQSGEDLRVPRFGSYSVATIVAENAPIGDSDPVTGEAVLGSFKYAFLLRTTRELVEDEAVDLIPALARQGGMALARGAGAHFVAGTGTGQPNGANQATIGVTAASATAVTGDELIELQGSLNDGYSGVFVMNKATKTEVRKLKDGNNAYLWQPGLRAGEQDVLLGDPIFTDAGMPVMATGNRAIIYGDLSVGYMVRIVRGADIARSDFTDFANDRVVWRFILRADGDIIDTEAIRVLAML